MGSLKIVATPIGNLGDITLRAVETLKGVDLILCEDTRVTKRLLEKYGIRTSTLAYHQHSKIEKILRILEEGKNLALVSDAGTPAISDPGAALVARIRSEYPQIKIESIPGPNAAIAALSISGFPSDQFLFLGFLPHKKGRETLFKEIKASKRTVVFYESPHRILKTLEFLANNLPPAPSQGRGVVGSYKYHTTDPKTWRALESQAVEMRSNPTEAERLLWHSLRKNITGCHFRRQHIIGRFIVDFVCLEKLLVVEVDGDVHDYQESEDKERTLFLNEIGFKVLRVKNSKVTEDISSAVEKIKENLEALPLGEGRGGVDRRIFVARELTKIHEEGLTGTASEIMAYFKTTPDKVRGEFVVVVRNV